MDFAQSFELIVAEALLSIGGLVLLLAAAWLGDRSSRAINYAAIALLVAAAAVTAPMLWSGQMGAGTEAFLGQMRVDVMHTPGHTPACLTYVIGDAAFVGDTLFMPDFGTARCDFPGGSSETLFDSVQKILALPDETRIFVCHDYKAPGRDEYAWETTVGAQKALNIHIGAGKSKADFVAMRDARDATLAMPRLIIPSLQINMRAGQMPEPEDNGISYLKVPLNGL